MKPIEKRHWPDFFALPADLPMVSALLHDHLAVEVADHCLQGGVAG
ncbi:hypothetical protein [Pseudomonas sp. SDI]|nr:hypothetical protein [Pseudomonas sp. SDI]